MIAYRIRKLESSCGANFCKETSLWYLAKIRRNTMMWALQWYNKQPSLTACQDSVRSSQIPQHRQIFCEQWCTFHMHAETLQLYRICIFLAISRCCGHQSPSPMSIGREREAAVTHRAGRSRNRAIQVRWASQWEPNGLLTLHEVKENRQTRIGTPLQISVSYGSNKTNIRCSFNASLAVQNTKYFVQHDQSRGYRRWIWWSRQVLEDRSFGSGGSDRHKLNSILKIVILQRILKNNTSPFSNY